MNKSSGLHKIGLLGYILYNAIMTNILMKTKFLTTIAKLDLFSIAKFSVYCSPYLAILFLYYWKL